MKPGSSSSPWGGAPRPNCELTEPGQAVVKHGVTIVGYTDLNSRLPSSLLPCMEPTFRLTKNCARPRTASSDVNMEDDAIRGLTVIKSAKSPGLHPAEAASRKPAAGQPVVALPRMVTVAGAPVPAGKVAAMFRRRRIVVPADRRLRAAAFLGHFTVFVLACFVGYMVVWNVTPALHTPLDERHQCDQQHHRHRRAGADRTAAGASGWIGRTNGYAGWRWRASRSLRSTCSAASPSLDACCRCSQIRINEYVCKFGNRRLYRRNHPLHPQPGRSVQPESSRRAISTA